MNAIIVLNFENGDSTVHGFQSYITSEFWVQDRVAWKIGAYLTKNSKCFFKQTKSFFMKDFFLFTSIQGRKFYKWAMMIA